MADFGYLSDTDDSAVDELISQMKDLSVLEQVSKINCSGFTDSLLPSDLDTRFQKLKSLSFSSKNMNTSSSFSVSDEIFSETKQHPDGKFEKDQFLKDEMEIFLENKQNPDEKAKIFPETREDPDEKFEKDKLLKEEMEIFSETKQSRDRKAKFFSDTKQDSNGKFKESSNGEDISDFLSINGEKDLKNLSSLSSSSSMDSPPKKIGCFCCSPKRKKMVSKKMNKENMNLDWGNDNIFKNISDDDEEFLSVLKSFSYKEQEKILKKAKKEEEKINKEAEKIVKWTKQASKRINSFNGIGIGEDEFSDQDANFDSELIFHGVVEDELSDHDDKT